MQYCDSRFSSLRRKSVVVNVGHVGVGGTNPLRLQSMTTSDTQDIAATVAQSISLAEVGCEIVRITAPNVPAAQCLREIRAQFSAAGFAHIPLVADIHFLPQAAMEAVEHVEKIRVNPGNYADKKRFAQRDYSDADYALEIERLHEAFSPLVLRCKTLGRSLRIGTNHGSLSDRILNRYGDSPMGMVESALEFVRICEAHHFHDIILSMKASNPKVVVQAYRLLVAKMDAQHRAYPLHLGVTEAGDGEDGRIKSAIGIGTLLMDGIGDTIRVSLTEDSIYEIPVARALAEKTQLAWSSAKSVATPLNDCLDPFKFQRRESQVVTLGPKVQAGGNQFPRVLTPAPLDPKFTPPTLPDTPCEGLLFKIVSAEQIRQVPQLADIPNVLDLGSTVSLAALEAEAPLLRPGDMLTRTFAEDEAALLTDFARFVRSRKLLLALDLQPNTVAALGPILQALGSANMVVTLADYRAKQATVSPCTHALGSYRGLVEAYRLIGFKAPLWIRSTTANSLQPSTDPLGVLLEGSVLLGGLLCDGLGDLVSVETESSPERSQKLAYNILQGAGSRITKTEYVACPSCGRTLFDLQSTTQRIRSMTGHLKGVKIAIMGCIVNGPGEMADADFGYVGGAPGKINLYVGKDCVQFNIPQAEADARLIALIRKHGKWLEPVQPTASA